MGLGILEDTKLEHVPGECFWVNAGPEATPTPADEMDPRLKYDTRGPKPILLIPQPSDDPNDPLNWPMWKRDLITLVLCAISVSVEFVVDGGVLFRLGPLLAANTVWLKVQLRISFTDTALLTGWHLLGVGVAGFFFVPTSRVWGKRHAYIIATLLLIGSSVWGGAAKGHKSLLWARVFQGFAVAPFEALVNASIGDMYCVHDRGKRMAFTNFALYGGAFLTPVIVGKLTIEQSWRWVFYWVAIAGAVISPFVWFFVPETAYRREVNTDIDDTSALFNSSDSSNKEFPEGSARNVPASSTDDEITAAKSIPPKKTFLQSLALFDGRKTDDSLWKLALRPLPLLFQPAIIWGMLTQGALIGWTVLIGVVIGAFYSGPPKFYAMDKVGYLYTGSFLGALAGFIVSGVLADSTAKLLAKWNNGVYEPEFRIILVIPQLIFGVMGVFGFGYTADDVEKWGDIIPPMFFGFEVMGMVLGATSSALYLVDAHRDIAIESFTALLLFKNFFSFALTWYGFDWINETSVWKMMWAAGTAQICICLLSVPMYIFGKRNRSFFHRHNILEMCGLD
ncbi:MFS general substrate transporter [Ascodesmis nigricans]|uniref:MFS general substrate transporter n=1 Tax=Ascodesmis nigricans TaxID=341454 RepID=A0A4S2MQ34_9PEZI|nr:MFS general substrate transporter [Ascodesmis nigricans]